MSKLSNSVDLYMINYLYKSIKVKELQLCVTSDFKDFCVAFSTLGYLLYNWTFLFGTLLLNFAIPAQMQKNSNVKNAFNNIVL